MQFLYRNYVNTVEHRPQPAASAASEIVPTPAQLELTPPRALSAHHSMNTQTLISLERCY